MKRNFILLSWLIVTNSIYGQGISKKTIKDSLEVIALCTKAFDSRYDKPSKTVEYALKARALASRIHYNRGIAETYRIKGIGERYLNQPDSAMNSFAKAIEIFEQINDENGRAAVYNDIGTLYEMIDYDKALENLSIALMIAHKHNSPMLIASIYLNLGNIYNRQNIYAQAIFSYNKSYEIFKQFKDGQSLSNQILCLANLGVVYYSLRDFTKAKQYLFKAHDSAKIRNMISTVATINLTLTDLFVAENNFKDAEKYLEEGKKYSDILENEKDIYDYKHTSYEMELKRKNYKKALGYLISIYKEDSTSYRANVSTKVNLLVAEQKRAIQKFLDREKILKSTNKNGYFTNWFYELGLLLITHFAFWSLLLFAYPSSKIIQSVFFWNPSVRNILGLGYVSFLIIYIPFLRKRLFSPKQLQDSLLSNARRDSFKYSAYFQDVNILEENSDSNPIKITTLSELKNQIIILRGASGLGKTDFLRFLCKQKNEGVFLLASECKNGVIEGIRSKMFGGGLQDIEFLSSLIYNGSLQIFIDGINEVEEAVRIRINEFITKFSKSNCIITTQPIDWQMPENAIVFDILPLSEENIELFLDLRYDSIQNENSVSKTEYTTKVSLFLTSMLASELNTRELTSNRVVLSNPMDLIILSYLLINRNYTESPNLLSLEREYYEMMVKGYDKIYSYKGPFPLTQLSKHAFELRLNDLTEIDSSIFADELKFMGRPEYRIVINRTTDNHEVKWYFRHDKIFDFFIAQSFDAILIERHLHDTRFRGVYLLLANVLPREEAEKLKNIFVEYAATTKDHSLSDDIVLLLKNRAEI